MLTPRRLAPLVLAATLTAFGCHAQSNVAAGAPLSPSVTHRIEVMLRQKAQLPPGAVINFGTPEPSDVPGYSKISVSFTDEDKTSHPVNFLLSNDGKTIAQLIKYDISADPKSIVSAAGRPSRGGPPTAPVVLVNFDDLECPFCARFNASLFPAITQRYGDKVRVVYKDFPIEQHPWAMHAAVDVECMAAQSPAGYWNLVDYIHAHASEIGKEDPGAAASIKAGAPGPASGTREGSGTEASASKPEHSLDRAYTQLDKLTRDQGAGEKVDAAKLDACIAKQDTSAIDASKRIGESLSVDSTPSFFINGAKYDGAVPLDYIFAQIDNALRAENIAPPPPYVAPATPSAPAVTPVPATTKPKPAVTDPAPTK